MENFDIMMNSTVIAGLIIGACVLLFSYILRSFKTDKMDNTVTKKQPPIHVEKRKEPENQKPRKRAVTHRWSNRGKQQHFSHPWHSTSFKGHTGNVLDLDFSSNGKYLATCSDDDPGGVSTEDSSGSSISSSEGNKENLMSTSRNTFPRKGLSRRQKKNRRSLDASLPEQKVKMEDRKQNSSVQNIKINKFCKMPILEEFEQLHLYEEDFCSLLRGYLLLPQQLFSLGFPEQFENKVRILKQTFTTPSNAQNYYNKKKSGLPPPYSDIDETSNSSSDGQEDTEHAKPNIMHVNYNQSIPDPHGCERTCARCGTGFFTTSTEYLTQERCIYHYGKVRCQWEKGCRDPMYTCCGAPPNAKGCTVGPLHVWNGLKNGLNDQLEGFVKTLPKKNKRVKPGIYALDCEMCYTIKGLELCKVTVVGMDGRLIYNSFVRPECQVIDYNTRFSGVTERDVTLNSRTLKEVQRDLLSFINDETILVGHALDNDLRALKILHNCIVDTSLSFPHERGYPYRYSLKQLVWRCLRKEIQSSVNGHDSYEDAVSCMELMLWKIVRDVRCHGLLRRNATL
ncbi:hypothetical protein WA026_015426 [Henosepilachna vigintioctopunctata]|uniref:Exonuclease domain-containing protein n=1 Tax=Henosepilachna vigintioctopunctata TaxID=420089 RepID=A0AAW1UMR5_9CUCU